MAQSTILAAGTTVATSTDVVVAAGSAVTVGIFVASGVIGATDYASVLIDTPGADLSIAQLSNQRLAVQLAGPGTFRVARGVCAASVGVFLET